MFFYHLVLPPSSPSFAINFNLAFNNSKLVNEVWKFGGTQCSSVWELNWIFLCPYVGPFSMTWTNVQAWVAWRWLALTSIITTIEKYWFPYFFFSGAQVRSHEIFGAHNLKSSRICDQLVVNFDPCFMSDFSLCNLLIGLPTPLRNSPLFGKKVSLAFSCFVFVVTYQLNTDSSISTGSWASAFKGCKTQIHACGWFKPHWAFSIWTQQHW